MSALALSAALVAAVPAAFIHGHATATRTITNELAVIAAAEEPGRPPDGGPG